MQRHGPARRRHRRSRRTSPVAVTSLTDVVEISGGRDLSLALKSDGTVWAWGLDTDGELGDGGSTNSSGPGAGRRAHRCREHRGGPRPRARGGVRRHRVGLGPEHLRPGRRRHQGGQALAGPGARASATATDVAAGADFSVALLAGGRYRELGRERARRARQREDRRTRRRRPWSPACRPSQRIDCGRDHTLAVTDDRAAVGLGLGQLRPARRRQRHDQRRLRSRSPGSPMPSRPRAGGTTRCCCAADRRRLLGRRAALT